MNLTLVGAAASSMLMLGALSFPAPADAAPRMCAGKKVTIVGTSGNDHINGTRKADVIDGLAGSDVINGLQGNDTICGNIGSDDLRGNAGDDRIYGGLDAMTFDGAESFARLGDTLRGGSGNDILVPGYDSRDGFIPPEGPVGDVDDLVTYDTSPGPVRLNLRTQVATGDGTDRVVVNGRVRLFTTRWADTVVGLSYETEFQLFEGNDKVSDGSAADLLYGGPGSDDNVASAGGRDSCISIEVNTQNC